MHARTWVGLSLAASAILSADTGAQTTRSVREAVELTARQHALQEALTAQALGASEATMAAHAARMAVEQAQIAGRIDVEMAAVQARMMAEQARMDVGLMEPGLHATQLAIESMAMSLGGTHRRSLTRQLDDMRPAFRSLPQDPADSLYRAGRERLNAREWERAADLFRLIRTQERYERSGYRPDAHYWEAFALAQRGRSEDLQRAREVLEQMRRTYPDGQMIRDASALAATIDGRLARTGDAQAAESIYRLAELEAATTARGRAATAARSRSPQNPQCPQDEQDDLRIAALSALLNVDSDRTVPVLREVMQRRDECSAPLRRRALMLISRSRDPEAARVLLDAARNDPDEGVREQAVLFLGTIRTPEANEALQAMLRESNDVDLQRRALMALTQQGGEESAAMLRDFATRDNVPADLRRQAILLLSSRRGGGNAENRPFLRDLFTRTNDEETRAAILHALMSDRSAEGVEWLMGVALNQQLPVDLRRQALFIAGQTEHVPVDRLSRLYDQAADADMKEHVLFTLARRSEPGAFDKLVSIARSDSNLEIRRKAIFWLGQSKDPRAPEVLLELIR